MTDKTFAVHLFEVDEQFSSVRFDDALESIRVRSLEQRNHPVNEQVMRLEEIVPPTQAKPYWLLDFGRFRNFGPGQGSHNTPIRDIQLDTDHSFAEDTAALYCRGRNGTGWLILQYNHVGTRASHVSPYISGLLQDEEIIFELGAKLTGDSFAKLDRATHFTKLKVKVATASLTRELLDGGLSIKSALEASIPLNGDYVTIEISTRKRKAERSINVPPIAEWLKRLVRSGAAETAQLKAGSNEYPLEPIDLLEGKLTQRFKLTNVVGSRVTRDDRWELLERTYTAWSNHIQP